MTNQHIINHIRTRRPLQLAVLVTVLALATLVVANWPTTGADAASPETPVTGISTARIVGVDAEDGSIELDPLEILSGEAARQAAVAAGEIAPGEDLPNDFYLLDETDDTVRLPAHPTATVAVLDCTLGCELVEATLADLLKGELDFYGGDTPFVEVTIEDGEITHIAEVYLP